MSNERIIELNNLEDSHGFFIASELCNTPVNLAAMTPDCLLVGGMPLRYGHVTQCCHYTFWIIKYWISVPKLQV